MRNGTFGDSLDKTHTTEKRGGLVRTEAARSTAGKDKTENLRCIGLSDHVIAAEACPFAPGDLCSKQTFEAAAN